MSALGRGQVKMTIFDTMDLKQRVRASVFAAKLSALVRALEAADKSANGNKLFDHVIADLVLSSATAVIQEKPSRKTIPEFSSVEIFGRCLHSIASGEFEDARRHMECTRQVAAIAKDVTNTFDKAELMVSGFDAVTVDLPFCSRVQNAVSTPRADAEVRWFKGSALGSLDGTIIAESIETGAATMTLRLSVGNDIRVKCECPDFEPTDIAPFFGKRVRVSGRLYYKGEDGLPYKIELLQLPRFVKSDPDLARWKGAFGISDEAPGWNS